MSQSLPIALIGKAPTSIQIRFLASRKVLSWLSKTTMTRSGPLSLASETHSPPSSWTSFSYRHASNLRGCLRSTRRSGHRNLLSPDPLLGSSMAFERNQYEHDVL